MKKLYYVLNGPNINMLGIREPEHYGSESYAALKASVLKKAKDLGIKVKIYQSNHEGDLVDYIQKAYFEGADGIVLNPGAYTHTSIALLDAIKAVSLPVVEVHISDISLREDFRKVSYIRMACLASIVGHGTNGYLEAIDLLLSHVGVEV